MVAFGLARLALYFAFSLAGVWALANIFEQMGR